MSDENNFPVNVYEYKYRIPFIFKIYILVEDRRPDLKIEKAQEILGYKYKTQIEINVLCFKKINFIVHSLNRPSVNFQ